MPPKTPTKAPARRTPSKPTPVTKSAPSPVSKASPSKPSVPRLNKPGARAARTPKTFEVIQQATGTNGKKIVMYGKSGIGKSTLASLAPNPIFLDVDHGIGDMVHPVSGEPLRVIPGVECFEDIRDALNQDSLFPAESTVIVDTFTRVEALAADFVLRTIPKKGKYMTSIKEYGWGDGDKHVNEQFGLLLSDLERLTLRGCNVMLLCQLAQRKISNAEGSDYLEDGPKLPHTNQCSVRTDTVEWADHVLRLGYLDFQVAKDDADDRVGKVISEDATRGVFSGGAQYFIAKSRRVPNGGAEDGRVPSVVGFEADTDNSIWHFIFGVDPN